MKTLALLFFPVFCLGQCPTFVMEGNYQEFTYCGGENAEPWNTNTPCGVYTHYYTIEFESQQPYTTLTVTSQMNYTFAPFTPWNWAIVHVIDACGGSQIWNTMGGACSVGQGQSVSIGGNYPGPNWFVDLALPEGTYYVVFGYAMQPDQFGCVTVGIGNPGFLNIDEEGDAELAQVVIKEKKLPRRTKVIIEGRGVYIRDNVTGKMWDIRNRQVR